MQSLPEKYRPQRLAEMVGQARAVRVLSAFIANPRSTGMLFTGSTGIGKTTAALCLANELGCRMEYEMDGIGGLAQIPAGEQTADRVRKIGGELCHIPFYGSGWRVLIVNECDAISPQAAVAWLDILEHLPSRTVVIFTTNNPDSLPQRFIDRCMAIEFETSCNGKHLIGANELIARIWAKERPGEPTPTARDIPGAYRDCQLISYRRVVQAVAARLLDPEPFTPEVAEPVKADLFAGPVNRKTYTVRQRAKFAWDVVDGRGRMVEQFSDEKSAERAAYQRNSDAMDATDG